MRAANKATLIGDRLAIVVTKSVLTVTLMSGAYALYEWTAPYIDGDTLSLTGLEIRLPLEITP